MILAKLAACWLIVAQIQYANAQERTGEVKPGVFRIPAKQVLRSELLGSTWDGTQLPLKTLDNYMFVMECQIGTMINGGVMTTLDCIFDTSTAISSTFGQSFKDYSINQWNPSWSTTKKNTQKTLTFNSIGLEFRGTVYEDKWCLITDTSTDSSIC